MCTSTPLRHGGRRAPLLLPLLLLLLLCHIAVPTHAFVYTVTATPAELPAVYATTSPLLPLKGLFDACDRQTSGTADRMLMTVRGDVTDMLQQAANGGVIYLGGYYNVSGDVWLWWDGRFGNPIPFATGPSGTVVGAQKGGWAPNYPQLSADGSVGARRYMAFNSVLKGWVNVDGTDALNGVACESRDVVVEVKKSFPWWGILIIVVAVVVVIVIVVVVVCCCCCRKSRKHYDDADDDDDSRVTSRSGSFTTRGTTCASSSAASSSFTSRGTSYTAGTSSASFVSSSRGTSRTGTSATGTSAEDTSDSGSSATGSHATSSAVSSSRGTSRSGSSVATSSARSAASSM